MLWPNGGPPPGPINTVAPTISGDTLVGSTLTVDEGTWTGAPTFTYQWTRDSVAISGATSTTYVTTFDDVGAAIRCEVTGTNVDGESTATSNAITVVDDGAWDEVTVAAINFSEETGTTWTVSTDGNGDPLSVYDKLVLIEDNADGGLTTIEVQNDSGTWLTGASDYSRSYRTDNGQGGADAANIALRQLTSGSDASAEMVFYNFGLAARTHGHGFEWASAAGEKCVSFDFQVNSAAVLQAIRITAGSNRMQGRLKIKGKKK